MELVERLLEDLRQLTAKLDRVSELLEGNTLSMEERVNLYGQEFSLVLDISSIHEDISKELKKISGVDPLAARRLQKEADSYLQSEVFNV